MSFGRTNQAYRRAPYRHCPWYRSRTSASRGTPVLQGHSLHGVDKWRVLLQQDGTKIQQAEVAGRF